MNERALAAAIAGRLGGDRAADGSLTAKAAAAAAVTEVIWVDRGDEVLVHLDSVRVEIADRLLLISVELETDQTGRTPLVVAYALGDATDPAGLVVVTDDLPRGNGVLASRWGKILQEAVWASILAAATDQAQRAGKVAVGLSATAGFLRLHTAGTALRLPFGAGAIRAGPSSTVGSRGGRSRAAGRRK